MEEIPKIFSKWLRKEGHKVNRKRVNRLMRQMGLYLKRGFLFKPIYPKPL
ncbi:MAG: transposase [wastewater metagenome]|nr:transposase [Candidatus Loosdrechtia aerotolerans]